MIGVIACLTALVNKRCSGILLAMFSRVDDKKPRVVVLGGGNGTSRLLEALLPLLHAEQIESLHALVLNADDGGSTGRLRQQYGVSAMGDVTRCLMALSGFHGDIRGEQLLMALNHRFDTGDFAGHTLRNVFLASLEKTSDLDAAIAMMARILQVPKAAGVVPTTLDPLNQQVVVEVDGHRELLGEGQHFISHNVNLQADPRWEPGAVRVQFAEKDAKLNPRAAEVIAQASHIIVAPGHTYGTILPTLALPPLGEAIAKSAAQVVVVMTLLTTPRQTTNWSGEDFVRVYESYMGRGADVVIGNTGESTEVDLVTGQDWVRFNDKKHDYQLISANLVSTIEQKVVSGDSVPRAVVIHDAPGIRSTFADILLEH